MGAGTKGVGASIRASVVGVAMGEIAGYPLGICAT